jgi:hypothetical protein
MVCLIVGLAYPREVVFYFHGHHFLMFAQQCFQLRVAQQQSSFVYFDAFHPGTVAGRFLVDFDPRTMNLAHFQTKPVL